MTEDLLHPYITNTGETEEAKPASCSTCGSDDGVPRWRAEMQAGALGRHVGWHQYGAACHWLDVFKTPGTVCQPCPTCSAKPKPEAAGVLTRGQIEEIGRGRIAYGDGGGDMVKLCGTALSLYDRAEAAERKLASIKEITNA